MTFRTLLAFWIAIIIIVGMASPGVAQPEPTPDAWDLRQTGQPGQMTFYDDPPGASTTGKPTEMGDFDGDGCGDMAMTGQNARYAAGQTRIFFGLCEAGWTGVVLDVAAPETIPSSIRMVTIYGEYPGDMFGTEIYHADLNHDGYDDLVVGAQNSDGPGLSRLDTGAVFVIFGHAAIAEQELIDLAEPPDNVLAIYGADIQDRLGVWVEGGDFDGDGIDDLLFTAIQADGEDNRCSNCGEAYILYGSENFSDLYAPVIDLAELVPPDLTVFTGADFDDLLGSTAYGGDLNNDGLDDAVISAALWRGSAGIGGRAQGGGDGPGNTRYNGGDTYIIFGKTDLRGQTINLTELIDEQGQPVDESLTVVYGPEARDYIGEEIVVGDLNNDGWNDLVLGSLASPGRDSRRIDGGEAWIVYVDESFPGQMFDLAQAGTGTVIYAADGDSKGGDTMLILDIDQDGYNDLAYAMPNADPVDFRGYPRPNAGILAILYGQDGDFPTEEEGIIDLRTPPEGLRIGFMIGADNHDMSSYGMATYDVDADGYPDIALNDMNGDGPDNGRTDAGEIYIVSGRHFTERLPQTPFDGTPFPEDTPSPVSTRTPFPSPAATVDFSQVDVEEGKTLFLATCAGCHGENGEGLQGLGVSLVESDFIAQVNNNELLAFIRQGRTGTAPDSITGRPMPPSGGRPDLTDEQLAAIILYIRSLGDRG